MTTQELLQKANAAKGAMALADTQTKNRALLAMAHALEEHCADILAANGQDLEAARGTVSVISAAWPRASGRRPPCPTRWGGSSAGWSGPTGWSLKRRRCPWG